eukprot:1786726-Amphidinium_carterae.1
MTNPLWVHCGCLCKSFGNNKCATKSAFRQLPSGASCHVVVESVVFGLDGGSSVYEWMGHWQVEVTNY